MEEEQKRDHIISAVIEDEMKTAYLDYAMSVIIGRALPDVRDGLKPVHRRILFAMNEMGIFHNKGYKKSARIVGEVLGKYHPHGDSAVYDSLVRMAQNFSLRYPLINGQGNFGSVDGDRAAAMRYTEAKLHKISSELLKDIEKETVNFRDNFDDTLQEPTVLPTKIPNLLINGSSGIAVGMATNIPPHNMSEVVSGVIALLDNEDVEITELLKHVKGPDFPTGGILTGKNGILEAYHKGKGKVRVKAVMHEEQIRNRNTLIVTEIPYQVNKSSLLEQIADAVRDKRIEGINDIRDESDRTGTRIVIELKKDANADVVKNHLYKHSRMQTTQSINLLALVDNQPKVLNLKQILEEFIKHRKEVVTRRTAFDLKKAQAKAHLLEGLTIALNHLDDVIALIKRSASAKEAKEGLMQTYELSELQAQAILDMKLQKLTNLEQDKIKTDYQETLELIARLEELLGSETLIKQVIKEELEEMKESYGDERKTVISDVDDDDIEDEDLIAESEQVVTITKSGYAKRIAIDTYKVQNRGGKGIIGTRMKEEDVVEHLFVANTHSYLLIITDRGQVHWLKVYKLPEGSRTSKGKALVNLVQLEKEEQVAAVIPVREFDAQHYLFMATKNGVVKKTNLEAYSRPRSNGIIGINLDEDDRVIAVVKTDGKQNILLATKLGQAVRFNEQDARPIGRTSRGVKGITLAKNDEVIGMILVEDEQTILTVTENGYGKRTPVTEYRLINRGGKGVRNIVCSERNGSVARVRALHGNEDLLLISRQGIIMRTNSEQISVIGRNTQGVRIMKLREDDCVTSIAKIEHDEDDITLEGEETTP